MCGANFHRSWVRLTPVQGLGDPDMLPPKSPPPGHDLDKLRERALGLEAFASKLLQQPGAVCTAVVISFFKRAP